jgi:hypothetical protein
MREKDWEGGLNGEPNHEDARPQRARQGRLKNACCDNDAPRMAGNAHTPELQESTAQREDSGCVAARF